MHVSDFKQNIQVVAAAKITCERRCWGLVKVPLGNECCNVQYQRIHDN